MKSFIVLAAVIAVVHGNSLICRNYRSGALIPNPENCVEFFMCRPGRAIQFSCPEHTQFNPAIQACDPTDAVRCKPGKLPLDIEYTPILALPSVIQHTNTACIGKQMAILLPNPNSCSSFYQCSPTGVIAFDCPAGTLFDANRKYCERSDITSCQNYPEIPVMPELPEFPPKFPEVPIMPQLPENPPNVPEKPVMPQLPTIPPAAVEDHILKRCRGQRPGTQIRHPVNCNQYIQCNSEGRSKVFTCAKGTAFDESRAMCDWERNVKC